MTVVSVSIIDFVFLNSVSIPLMGYFYFKTNLLNTLPIL